MTSESSPPEHLRDRAIAAMLLIACTAIFVASPISDYSDTRWALQVALSFARGHWGDQIGRAHV